MVVQAFVFNSQRNINARVSEPRGSSSRHVTYVGSGAGWGWMSCDGKGKGESLAVYRQPAQTQIPSIITWPRGPPPLHRQTDSTTVEEGQHSEYHQARTLVFSPFTLALGSLSAGDPSPRANCPDSATPFCPLPRATRSHVFVEELGRPITGCPRCVEWRCCHHHHLGVPAVVPGPFWPLSVKAVCMCANPSGYTAPPAAPSTPGSKKKNKKKKANGSNNTTTTAAAAANKPEPVAVDALGNDGAGSPEVEDEVDETLDSVCIHTHTSHVSSRAAWSPASP